jgi:hypothetical protein
MYTPQSSQEIAPYLTPEETKRLNGILWQAHLHREGQDKRASRDSSLLPSLQHLTSPVRMRRIN